MGYLRSCRGVRRRGFAERCPHLDMGVDHRAVVSAGLHGRPAGRYTRLKYFESKGRLDEQALAALRVSI